MTAVTALTAQNTAGVQGVEAPPVGFVATQMRSVLTLTLTLALTLTLTLTLTLRPRPYPEPLTLTPNLSPYPLTRCSRRSGARPSSSSQRVWSS